MSHKVVYKFKDLQTGHIYNVGDNFPHDGSEVHKARIKELSTDKNKLRKVLIVKVDDNDLTKTETVKNKTEGMDDNPNKSTDTNNQSDVTNSPDASMQITSSDSLDDKSSISDKKDELNQGLNKGE